MRLDCRPELSPLENVSQQEFDLDKYGLELLVLDTQAPHQLNDGQYAQRRATCEKAAEILGAAGEGAKDASELLNEHAVSLQEGLEFRSKDREK